MSKNMLNHILIFGVEVSISHIHLESFETPMSRLYLALMSSDAAYHPHVYFFSPLPIKKKVAVQSLKFSLSKLVILQ